MPGEKIVAGGSRNGRVYMWDIGSGKQIDFPAKSDHRVSQSVYMYHDCENVYELMQLQSKSIKVNDL